MAMQWINESECPTPMPEVAKDAMAYYGSGVMTPNTIPGWIHQNGGVGRPAARRVQWIGGPPVGVGQDVTTTPGYQACIGAAIVKCNDAFPNWQTDPDQRSSLDACIKASQDACKLQAEGAAGAAGSLNVTALQTQINIALKKYGYCPIGVDGKLGGNTCGAAIWASSAGEPVVVPSQCNTIPNTFQLKDCPTGAQPPPPPLTVECNSDTDCPPGKVCVEGKCVGCTSTADCPAGQTCVNGNCQKVTTASAGGGGAWALALLGLAAVGAIFMSTRPGFEE